jgi:hypothetical protein
VYIGVFHMGNNVNWEKVGLYIAIMASFFTVIHYIADIKERVAKLEVKVDVIQKDIGKP